MDYISVNELKKQSDKVQKLLLKWWKENVKQYDMFYRKFHGERQKYIVTKVKGKVKGYELETITLRNREISLGRDAWTEKWNINYIWDIIPLLTEGQLRNFIEDKTGGKCDIEWDVNSINIEIWNDNIMLDRFALPKTNLLQTYWQIVCKIAEEDNND